MKYKLEVFQIQEFGMRRDAAGNPHQEDSMFPAFGNTSPADRLFILCDGMGGHEKGEVASATVCETMGRTILRDEPSPEAPFFDSEFQKALSAAYDALDAYDSGSEKKMGTTLTFLKLAANGAFIAHIGDSRVYHIRPGKDAGATRILHMTQDHSLVNDLLRVGELTEEEAKTFPRRNVITRAMQPGMSPRPRADIFTTADIRPGDYFYLCSDGMLENMEDSNIRFNFSDMAGDALTKVEILRKATASNSDNHTAFIVHILDVTADVADPVSPDGNNNVATAPVSPSAAAAPSPASVVPPVGTPVKADAKAEVNPQFDTEARKPADQSKGIPAKCAGRRNCPISAAKNFFRKTDKKVWIYGLAAIAVIAIAGILFFAMGDKEEEEEDYDFPIERANYDESVIESINPGEIPREQPRRRNSGGSQGHSSDAKQPTEAAPSNPAEVPVADPSESSPAPAAPASPAPAPPNPE